MSLDQNLFTLHITPNKDDPNVIDLVDNSPNPIVHYRKQRVPGQTYKIEVYDPLSESLLITATAPNAASKQKTLELSNPTTVVELKHTGTISFKWGFKWEEHDFEWKREECFMLRKPDPPVLVAVTKVSQGRFKSSSVQILDYNLNRFDIDDRKGLEIVMLTALLTFQDLNEQYHSPREELPLPPAPTNNANNAKPAAIISRNVSATAAPTPPPKPAPKTGVDRIAEMQSLRGEYNEITVEDEGIVDDYAQYCWNLLQDDALLFITLRSDTADQVPKVLQVVEQTKRIRYKTGISEEEELHQYVLYDTTTQRKGPRRINLDSDNSKGKTSYTPPTSLTVHLSKIPMPELQPKPSVHDKAHKDFRKIDDRTKNKRREERKASPESNKLTNSNTTPPPRTPRSPNSSQRFPLRQPSPPPVRQSNTGGNYSPTQLQLPTRHTRSTSYPNPPTSSRDYAHPPSEPPPSLYGPYAPYQPGAARSPSPYRPPPGQPDSQRPASSSAIVSGIWEILHRR